MDEGSRVHFVIKNFGFKTGGDFKGLKGTIKFDPGNLPGCSFNATVDASTIDTDNGTRDRHLKKDEYFDVAKHPVIGMVSTKIEATGKPGIYMFTGNLTIKGITKPVKFSFNASNNNNGYLFTGEFGINRRDFNIGGSSISMADNLKVSLSIFAK
jgi:polyisoprenoid-binding protein YceI